MKEHRNLPFVIEPRIIAISFSSIELSRLLVKFYHNHICTSKYLPYCIMITSNANRDSFHALTLTLILTPTRHIYIYTIEKVGRGSAIEHDDASLVWVV